MSKSSVMKKWKFKQAAVGIDCWICEEPILRSGNKGKGHLTADHVVPKALGGTDAKENLKPAHAKCNHKRGTMILSEFQDRTTQEAILKRAVEIIDLNNQSPTDREKG